ncbi:menaquinol-cytochrome c reductase cytochrome b subunit precursor [Actinopolymorpha singaporensis]|uniref:Cytochrome bc1 complex cytochrome b subunit n=1 Tax=Actinopolymorpha singaporensis TaxID=117157 RepID=A0A1H1TK66_9ACTN|nr:menaquinol-cytochrome c reductase cytochrome b subunit precursor [Actinopolymorpha singaporensis]
MVGVADVSLKPQPVRKKESRLLRRLDERLEIAPMARKALAKIFPDHWSFMLGEIAMYSFIILVATGVYLALFFEPGSSLRIYHGEYPPMHGLPKSAAFVSTVELSWDVRGGLLLRQAHHWAAHIFVGAIVLHMCRIFFTGMFRKPRGINWAVGLTMLILAIFNGFAGYSLPDDLLSGTGLHIFNSISLSVPVVGAWLTFLVFGGEFPGDYILERLYALHIFLVPALIAGLLAVHMAILIKQKHSHFSGPGRRDSNVVGSRVWPSYALRSFALLCAVAAVVFVAGGIAQINPVWVWGDFDAATITSPSVADWYILWVEGGLRLFPPADLFVFGHLIPTQFWAGALFPLLTFVALYFWPVIERRFTGDRAAHHIAGRPRDFPVRTAIGVMALTFYAMLLVAGSQELIVQWTGAPIGTVRATLRAVTLGLPLVTGTLAYLLTRSLRRSDAEGLLSLSREDVAHAGKEPSEEDGEREERIAPARAPAVAAADRELSRSATAPAQQSPEGDS